MWLAHPGGVRIFEVGGDSGWGSRPTHQVSTLQYLLQSQMANSTGLIGEFRKIDFQNFGFTKIDSEILTEDLGKLNLKKNFKEIKFGILVGS